MACSLGGCPGGDEGSTRNDLYEDGSQHATVVGMSGANGGRGGKKRNLAVLTSAGNGRIGLLAEGVDTYEVVLLCAEG